MPESIEHKIFRVFGIDLECHVLDDGRRIISSDGLVRLLNIMAIGLGEELEKHELDHFIFWCKQMK